MQKQIYQNSDSQINNSSESTSIIEYAKAVAMLLLKYQSQYIKSLDTGAFTLRYSEDTKQNIDQEQLLEFALTANLDVICVSEMKSAETFVAQEAERTGHAAITTTHVNSCEVSDVCIVSGSIIRLSKPVEYRR